MLGFPKTRNQWSSMMFTQHLVDVVGISIMTVYFVAASTKSNTCMFQPPRSGDCTLKRKIVHDNTIVEVVTFPRSIHVESLQSLSLSAHNTSVLGGTLYSGTVGNGIFHNPGQTSAQWMSHVFMKYGHALQYGCGILLPTLDLDLVHEQVLTLCRPLPTEKTRTETSDLPATFRTPPDGTFDEFSTRRVQQSEREAGDSDF